MNLEKRKFLRLVAGVLTFASHYNLNEYETSILGMLILHVVRDFLVASHPAHDTERFRKDLSMNEVV